MIGNMRLLFTLLFLCTVASVPLGNQRRSDKPSEEEKAIVRSDKAIEANRLGSTLVLWLGDPKQNLHLEFWHGSIFASRKNELDECAILIVNQCLSVQSWLETPSDVSTNRKKFTVQSSSSQI